MQLIAGFLLNVILVFDPPTNRRERRCKAKIGVVMR